MSEHFQGQVAKIYTREGKTSSGKAWKSYSFKLKGVNPFFRLKGEPKFAEGDFIQFDADVIDDNASQVVEGSGSKWEPPAKQEVAKEEAKATKPAAANKSSFNTEKELREKYWADKETRDIEFTQPRINFQAARNAAISVVQVLSDQKALPISTADNKGGAAKRYEQIVDIVNKLTVQFYFDTDTLRLLTSVQDAGTIKVSNPGELPEDATEEQDDVPGNSRLADGNW